MNSEKERREFKRAFFAAGENITATIQTHGESHLSLSVKLLSVSGGGLSFLFSNKNENGIIKKGDQLTVTDIQTPAPLGPIASLGVEVRYSINHKELDRVGFGCRFNKISDALRNKIQNFVEYRLDNAAKLKKSKKTKKEN